MNMVTMLMRSIYLSCLFILIGPFASLFAQSQAGTGTATQYKIAYLCEDSSFEGRVGLCTIAPDGSSRQVLVTAEKLTKPVWAWDGTKLYFGQDQGATQFELAGLPPIDVPFNFDIWSLELNTGDHRHLTEAQESEFPIIAIPHEEKDDEPEAEELEKLLIGKSLFYVDDSVLRDDKQQVDIQLKMIDLPQIFTVDTGDYEVLGEGLSASGEACQSVPLAKPVGVSPEGVYLSASAMLCDELNIHSDSKPTIPGYFVIERETEAVREVAAADLPACANILDVFGGRAVEIDGQLTVPAFDTTAYPALDCNYYISADRKYMAFINPDYTISLIASDGMSPAVTIVPDSLPDINRLLWFYNGDYLLAYHSEGGPLVNIEMKNNMALRLLDEGREPSWSARPVVDFPASTIEVEVAALQQANEDEFASGHGAGGCSLIRK